MKIAILGFDVEGKSSYEYYKAKGHQLEIRDQSSDIEAPDGVPTTLGEHYLDGLDQFDLLVRTAGLPPQKILEHNPAVAAKITTQINEFMRACPTKNIIGVTGTKGKGTTSTLIAKMLEAVGKHVRLGGNIGLPVLDLLADLNEDSWVVLELSSFQLIDLKASPHVGVCLMVVPEHLNWHPDINDYTQAKAQLFAHQASEDVAIYLPGNELSSLIAGGSHGRKIPYCQPPGAYVDVDAVVIDNRVICQVNELKLLGEHNWQNVCAAVTAAWQVTQDVEAMRSVLTTFAGLEHRLEFVRELGGVKYYNDSFAATPDAAMAALNAIPEKKVLLIGGFDRNLSIDHLAQSVAAHTDNLRKVIIVGASAQRLAAELQRTGFSNFDISQSKNMAEIVSHARQAAQPGDAIVLSPGFASFDMFKNFEDRGQQFKAAVSQL